jgi:hypothetical protein
MSLEIFRRILKRAMSALETFEGARHSLSGCTAVANNTIMGDLR